MAYRQKDYTYNNSLSKEENILLDRLYKLRLSHMAEELERQLLNPNTELENFHTVSSGRRTAGNHIWQKHWEYRLVCATGQRIITVRNSSKSWCPVVRRIR